MRNIRIYNSMSEAQVIEYFQSLSSGVYWAVISFSAFIENVFPPFPGDSVIVFSGYLLSTKVIDIYSLIASILLGNLAGASLMYFFGLEIMEFFLKHLRSERLKKAFGKENLKNTHAWFDRYGFSTVLFSRFSAGIRFFVAIVAGMAKMRFYWFILAFTLATVIWNSLLVYAGYTAGVNWREILHYVRLYSGLFALLVLIVAIVVFIIRKKRKQSSNS